MPSKTIQSRYRHVASTRGWRACPVASAALMCERRQQSIYFVFYAVLRHPWKWRILSDQLSGQLTGHLSCNAWGPSSIVYSLAIYRLSLLLLRPCR